MGSATDHVQLDRTLPHCVLGDLLIDEAMRNHHEMFLAFEGSGNGRFLKGRR
jgi:hypothetical protein